MGYIVKLIKINKPLENDLNHFCSYVCVALYLSGIVLFFLNHNLFFNQIRLSSILGCFCMHKGLKN